MKKPPFCEISDIKDIYLDVQHCNFLFTGIIEIKNNILLLVLLEFLYKKIFWR